MIGAAVCLRVAGHDVIRPRPSEVPRASVALRGRHPGEGNAQQAGRKNTRYRPWPDGSPGAA